MKSAKVLKGLLLLLLSLILLLAACGGEEAAPADEEAAAPTESASPTAEPAAETEATATLPPPVVEEGEGEGQPEGGQPIVEEGEGESEGEAEPPAEPTTPAPTFPWPADRFGYGVQIHGNATVGDPKATMNTVANQLGLGWVKIQIRWATIHPSQDAGQWFFYDGVVDEAVNHGLNVMLSVVDAPAWTGAPEGERTGPPDDYSTFTAFLDELLTRYEGKVHAIEVWNEQNLDREWSTPDGIVPEDYVRLLEMSYNTIKAHNQDIIVISGALSPTGNGDWVRWADDFEWMDRGLAAGMLEYADCVGVHHNGINLPPDVPFDQAGTIEEASTASFRGPFDNPHHSWSFKTTLDTYAQKVQAVDPNMKLCVTEFGWASGEGLPQIPEGFGFAQDNTLEEQAQYIVQAFQQMHDSGNVWLAFLHNFDFGNKADPSHETVLYSLIDTNGVPRPAFGAVAEMEKAP